MAEKRKSLFSLSGVGDYLLQVSLIILSLFIAFGVERCNQSAKEDRKRVEYLEAIHLELQKELDSTERNLRDCLNDNDDLEAGMAGLGSADPATRDMAIARVAQVFGRGVFRPFPPTTYELMMNAGDGFLVRDLELRRNLAAITSFRSDYVKKDLAKHDELTLSTLDRFGQYVDMACISASEPAVFGSCITDLATLRKKGPSDLVVLLRHAELRAFHLRIASSDLEEVIALVAAARGLAPEPTTPNPNPN